MKDKIREIIEGSYWYENGEWFIRDKRRDILVDAIYQATRLDKKKINDIGIDLVDKHFPKGECQERGRAIVLYVELLIAIQDELTKEG